MDQGRGSYTLHAMRHLLPALMIAATLPLHAQTEFDAQASERLASMESRAMKGSLRSGAPPTRGYDMKYARCEWDLDPTVRYINGQVTFWFTALTDLDELVLDLTDSLDVADVIMGGQSLDYTRDGNELLSITLPSTLQAGDLDSLAISYHGVPPTSGFGSFAVTTHGGDTPALWTLSEPYGAHDWWPCKEDLNDKIDSLDLFITTPIAYRAAANGLLVNADTVGGQVTWHWRHRYPVATYLIGVAVTDYQVNEQYAPLTTDSLLMLTYAYPEHFSMAVSAATSLLPVITLYDSLFGPYPFAREKYGHAEFGWGGGMEHQTMSFMGSFSKEIMCHELGHQWFGDKVTCHSWAELWLNEGFATYASGLYYEFLSPNWWPIWKRNQLNNVTSQPDGSVFVTDTVDQGRLFSSRLTYNKASLVLHMMRWVCGDSAFFAGLRNYLDDPDLAYGTATTADLQAHLEATSGLDLTEFLDDWYYGEGYPSYTTIWSQDENGDVSVNLSQVTSHPSVSFFKLPVPLYFQGAGMDSTVVLNNTENEQDFHFHLPFEVDTVIFDPELWLISAQNFTTRVEDLRELPRRLIIYPNPSSTYINWEVPGHLHAVRVLDATGRTVLHTRTSAAGLDISALAPGTYLLEIKDNQGVRIGRFVRE